VNDHENEHEDATDEVQDGWVPNADHVGEPIEGARKEGEENEDPPNREEQRTCGNQKRTATQLAE